MTKNLSYKERENALRIRIEAHKKYSTNPLDKWLEINLNLKEGGYLLDLGCGTGNFFPIYADKLQNNGLIVGVEKELSLIKGAQSLNLLTPKILLNMDMDGYWPFTEGTFDYVISTFAIYYVDSSKKVLENIYKILKKRGEILLIGPSVNNAIELYDFNHDLFGIKHTEEAMERSKRLKDEFYPLIKQLFGEVTYSLIDNKVVFPNKFEFIEYYRATPLFEGSCEINKYKPQYKEMLEAVQAEMPIITKEMSVVWGRK